ncbi:MAG TPA: putative leader peptide [Actinospica sp.]|nr:putative leader peptide [Actinospica sp.]
MQHRLNRSGVRFRGLLVARRHVDLLRVNSALCS